MLPSRSTIFATGMMEQNATVTLDVELEWLDVEDIMTASNSTIDNLVSCVANAPPGKADVVRAAIINQTHNQVALTVVEMGGEFLGQPTSCSCIGVKPSLLPKKVTRVGNATAVLAKRWAYASSYATTAAIAIDALSKALAAAAVESGGGVRATPLAGLVECEVYARRASDAAAVRAALSAASIGAAVAPSLTVLVVKDGPFARSPYVSLQCVATTLAPSAKRYVSAVAPSGAHVTGVVADGLVFVGGVDGVKGQNATDALAGVEAVLHAAGTFLNETVACRFYAQKATVVMGIFYGFFAVFNAANFYDGQIVPPTRVEFVATSDTACATCDVYAKCIAATVE